MGRWGFRLVRRVHVPKYLPDGKAIAPCDFDVEWQLSGDGFRQAPGYIQKISAPLESKRAVGREGSSGTGRWRLPEAGRAVIDHGEWMEFCQFRASASL